MTTETDAAGRHAAYAFAAVMILVAGLVQIDVDVPLVGHLGSALVAIVFLYAPSVVAWRRGEDLDAYGFRADPIARGLVTAGVALAIIVPIFCVGDVLFYRTVCPSPTWHVLAPGDLCRRLHDLRLPPIDGKLGEFVAVQAIVVALPEELFFRGCLLSLLERRFPPKRRILGGGVGLALLLSSAAFAVVHLPEKGPLGLAVFFPGLLFGWMRSATGSILASTITHASSNILAHLLELSLFR